MDLDEELETYKTRRDELLRDEGKWVLIRGNRIVGIWHTFGKALAAGYKEFGIVEPFLVKQILAVEPIHRFVRGIPAIRRRED